MMIRGIAVAVVILAAAQMSSAQTIYPIDRASILQGAKFDFKVEFPKLVDRQSVKIPVNGADYTQVLWCRGEIVENEDGTDGSSVVFRGVCSGQPGEYEFVACYVQALSTA